MSPLTKAHFILPNGTVTGNYDRFLHMDATTKPLFNYIQSKNEWTHSIMTWIHWEAHGQALKKRPERQTHVVKQLHEMLPTTGQANKFDQGTRRCPLCPCLTEDRDHVLCCSHLSRQTWRETFLHDVADHCIKTRTNPQQQRSKSKASKDGSERHRTSDKSPMTTNQ